MPKVTAWKITLLAKVKAQFEMHMQRLLPSNELTVRKLSKGPPKTFRGRSAHLGH